MQRLFSILTHGFRVLHVLQCVSRSGHLWKLFWSLGRAYAILSLSACPNSCRSCIGAQFAELPDCREDGHEVLAPARDMWMRMQERRERYY